MQHQRFFKNSGMPGQQYPKKSSSFVGDNFYYNGNVSHPNGGGITPFHSQAMQMNANLMGSGNALNYSGNFSNGSVGSGNGCGGGSGGGGGGSGGSSGGGARQRFAPYMNKRSYANALMQTANQQRHLPYGNNAIQQQLAANVLTMGDGSSQADCMYTNGQTNGQAANGAGAFVGMSGINSTPLSGRSSVGAYDAGTPSGGASSAVTLQISNLDTTMDENDLKQYLINRLKPITSVLSIYFESLSVAKIKLQTESQARQVITHLHRKKIGHKRITVSYTRESSTLDSSTLRCQVAGLLKVCILCCMSECFPIFGFFITFVHGRSWIE